jgi:hypothetical protein
MRAQRWWNRLKKALKGEGFYHEIWYEWRDARGRVLDSGWATNIMALEGEEQQLQFLYQGLSAPIRYYVGLTQTELTSSSTAADAIAGEPPQVAQPPNTVATGYARVTLQRNSSDWPVVESFQHLGETHKRVVSKQFVFSNAEPLGGKPWPMVKYGFVLVRLSDNPVTEKLLFFWELRQGAFQFQPQATLTMSIAAGRGRMLT